MSVELGTAATQDSSAFATAAQGLEADAAVKSIVAGTGVVVDSTNPQNPIVSATGTGGGTVTDVSVVTANGFLATVANPTTTPAITIETGVTGILYGNGTGVAAALPGNFPTLNQDTTGNAAAIDGIATVAALRLFSGTTLGQTIFLEGYTTAFDGNGTGFFAWNTTSVAPDDGGIVIQVTGIPTGRWIRQYFGDPYVNFWGADPTGASASDTAFTNAFAYCSANKIGTLRMIAGTGYTSASTILHTVPVKVIGDGIGVDTPFNQFAKNPTLPTVITCTGAHAATPMVYMHSPSIGSGNALDGAGWENIMLVGNYAGATPATIGIQASSVCFCSFRNLVTSFFTTVGLQFDCIGGTHGTDWNIIEQYIYRPGDSTNYPHTYTSNGLHLYQEGTSSSLGCSMNRVKSVLYWPDVGATGYAVVFGGDHNIAKFVYGPIHFINSGYNLGWDNTVDYCAGVNPTTTVADTGTYGNVIRYAPTNGYNVTLNGTAQLHYELIDDVNSGRFYTPGYPIYDQLTLSPWQFHDNNGVTAAINSTIWSGVALADAELMSCTIPAPFNWNNGKIIGINIFWAASATATGTVVFEVNAFSDAPGTIITSGGTQSTTVASTAYTAAESVITNITLATAQSHTRGNALRVVVQRGTDTYTGTVIVTGVQVVYQSTGPHSTGAGTFGYGGMGT